MLFRASSRSGFGGGYARSEYEELQIVAQLQAVERMNTMVQVRDRTGGPARRAQTSCEGMCMAAVLQARLVARARKPVPTLVLLCV